MELVESKIQADNRLIDFGSSKTIKYTHCYFFELDHKHNASRFAISNARYYVYKIYPELVFLSFSPLGSDKDRILSIFLSSNKSF